MKMRSLILVALTLALVFQTEVVLVRSDSTFVGSYCEPTSGNYSALDVFVVSLDEVVASLLTDVSSNAFFSNGTAGTGDDQVYGLYYCNGALEASDCSDCVVAATTQIKNSCNTKEAIVWYLECTLRYANRDILSQVDTSPYAYLSLNQNVSDMTTFSNVLVTTLTGVIKEAAYNTTSEPPAYASAQEEISTTESLVAVAQCTPDIVGPDCSDCLQVAVANMSSCCSDTVGAMVFLPSCQLLYAISYTDNSTSPSTPTTATTNPFTTRSPSTTPSTTKQPIKGKLSMADGRVVRSRTNVVAGILTAIGFLFFMFHS